MDPFTLSAIIAGGSALAGTGVSAFATGGQNRKSRAFSREMYQRQFDDNLRLWEMQNLYNSPVQQVARLKAAGLNKALMYGSGGSPGVASSLSAPSAIKPEFNVPDLSGISNAGNAIANRVLMRYDRDIKVAQAANMRKQNDLLDQQIKLAETETRRKEFDLNLDIETRPTSVASREAQLQKLKADLTFTLDSNDRAQIQTATSVAEAMERILTARVGRNYTESLMKSEKLKRDLMRSDLDLRKQGITYSDPLWARMLVKHISQILPVVQSLSDSLDKDFNFSIFSPFKTSKPKGAGGSW